MQCSGRRIWCSEESGRQKRYRSMKQGNIISKQYKKDLIFAAAVLAAVVILGLSFQIGGRKKAETENGLLEITIDGEVYGEFPLDEDTEMTLSSSYGNNTVVIEAGSAYVKEADCPDRICVGMRKIASEGEIICCLPHRLFLTVRGGEDAAYDAVAY